MALFDRITIVCSGCLAEDVTFPLQPLRTDELRVWVEENAVKFCGCVGATCSVNFRPVAGADA